MNDKIDVLAVMDRLMNAPCDACSGDCGSANPPVIGCPQREAIEARAAIAELINAASAAEFHLTREHRAPMTVDAADYLTEVERDRNKLRAAIANVGGGK